MKLTSIGQPIATREFELPGRGKVTVRLGKPRKFRGDSSYFCPYEIRGPGFAHVRYAGGVDAIQALQLVMVKLGAELQTYHPSLKWDAGMDGDLGFPSSEDRPVSKRLAEELEDGLRKRFRFLKRRSQVLARMSDREIERLLVQVPQSSVQSPRKTTMRARGLLVTLASASKRGAMRLSLFDAQQRRDDGHDVWRRSVLFTHRDFERRSLAKVLPQEVLADVGFNVVARLVALSRV